MNEVIYRQAAIEEIKRCRFVVDAIEKIRGLPSAQPEIIRCKDCKHRYVDGDGVRYNVCELNHNKAQSDEWFCANGKRKDGKAK